MTQKKVQWVAVLGASLVATVVGAACGSDAAELPAPIPTPVVDAGTGVTDAAAPTPDASVPVEAGPLRAPFLRLVNNLHEFQPTGDARVCVSAGGQLLTETSIAVESFTVKPIELPLELGAKLATEAVTLHVLPFNVVKPCAEAIALEGVGVVELPAYPPGTFVGDRSYVVTLLGCTESTVLVCSARADGSFPPNASTVRGGVTELDLTPVDAASVGVQFLSGSLGLSALEEVVPLQAMATGGWNDGPKTIGTPLGFGPNPSITSAAIPTVGFLPPSVGGFAVHETDAAGPKRTQMTLSALTEVTFTAGGSYVVMNLGQSPAYRLIAFPVLP